MYPFGRENVVSWAVEIARRDHGDDDDVVPERVVVSAGTADAGMRARRGFLLEMMLN